VKVRDRLSPTQLKELEEGKVKEVLRGFKHIRGLWGRVLASDRKVRTEPDQQEEEAEREWLFEAERLVETFRETRNLFLTSRVGLITSVDGGQLRSMAKLQNIPFRGMIRKKTRRREGEQEEADEDRMASRLHLDLGAFCLLCLTRRVRTSEDLEHDAMTRKAKRADARLEKVNMYRGVSFDDWLRLFMQVSS
jgi:general transcription factor 3C polypeptide 3 (transcription factor C subunit 4)